MSKIKVNSIEAATGSTITIPSGQTLDISSTTLTLPSTVVTTTGTQTLTNKTIGVSQLSGTIPTTIGGTGLTTLGTAAQVLRVNSGATALEFATVSSDFVLLATTTVTSSTALVSLNGYFSSTYNHYRVMLQNVVPVSASKLQMRFRDVNGDVTLSDYRYTTNGLYLDTSGTNFANVSGTWNDNLFYITGKGMDPISTTASFGGVSGEVQILGDTQNATINKQYLSLCNGTQSNVNGYVQSHLAVGYLNRTEALTGVTFFFSTGNIASGVFKLYGIK